MAIPTKSLNNPLDLPVDNRTFSIFGLLKDQADPELENTGFKFLLFGGVFEKHYIYV